VCVEGSSNGTTRLGASLGGRSESRSKGQKLAENSANRALAWADDVVRGVGAEEVAWGAEGACNTQVSSQNTFEIQAGRLLRAL
jgi:hypothetical protein